jgi:hypothetical protein
VRALIRKNNRLELKNYQRNYETIDDLWIFSGDFMETRLKTRNYIQKNAQKIHEENEYDINKEKILTYVHTVGNISRTLIGSSYVNTTCLIYFYTIYEHVQSFFCILTDHTRIQCFSIIQNQGCSIFSNTAPRTCAIWKKLISPNEFWYTMLPYM